MESVLLQKPSIKNEDILLPRALLDETKKQEIKRIVVLGGLGFIGSNLARFLKNQGHFVRVVDIKSRDECYLPLKVDEIFDHCDLRDFSVASRAIKDSDLVFAMAADMGGIGFISEHFADVVRNSCQINLNVAENCLLHDVEKVFFASSACIYPEEKQLVPENEGLRESDAYPANPDTYYGWEKLFAEKIYRSYAENFGLNVRIARFHNIYGTHGTYKGGREKAPAALCRKVAMAKDGDSVEVWGDGKQTRTFLYIEDAVDAIVKLMESDVEEPLNIGSEELISVSNLAKLIIKISGKKLSIKYNPNMPEGVRGRRSQNDLIWQKLHWRPTITYEEGLKRTYNWINEQVNG